MQIIPDWLPFGRKSGEASLPDSLDHPSPDSPLTAAEAMCRQLPALLASQQHQPARLKLLEVMVEKTRRILPLIERQVETAPLPLPADTLQAALTADNLLKLLATGYLGLLATIRLQNVPASASSVGRLATLRSMECLTRRQQLACRAYAPPSGNCWRLIHQTYAYASQQQLTGFSSGGRTIEHEYILALLLAWSDPTKFSRQDFSPLLSCLIHFAPLAKVRLIGSESATFEEHAPLFLILDNDPHAGKRLVKPVQSVNGRAAWLVDCRNVLTALDQSVHHRRNNAPDFSSESTIPLTVLETVRNSFRVQRARRFGRQSFKPRGDLIAGLPALVIALGSAGRTLDGPTVRLTDLQGTSEWAIVDESPDGFGLRYLRGESNGLQVGEVVGLRPRERDRRLHICIVRRVLNSGASRLELGLQELSPQARVVNLPTPEHGNTRRGVFFPALPAWKGTPGLLAESGTINQATRIVLPGSDGELLNLRPLRTLENLSRYELWQLTDQ